MVQLRWPELSDVLTLAPVVFRGLDCASAAVSRRDVLELAPELLLGAPPFDLFLFLLFAFIKCFKQLLLARPRTPNGNGCETVFTANLYSPSSG